MQCQVRTAVFRSLAFEAAVIAGICLDGGDSLLGRALLTVGLAGKITSPLVALRLNMNCSSADFLMSNFAATLNLPFLVLITGT